MCKRNAEEPRLRTHHNIIWQEYFESSKDAAIELSVQVVYSSYFYLVGQLLTIIGLFSQIDTLKSAATKVHSSFITPTRGAGTEDSLHRRSVGGREGGWGRLGKAITLQTFWACHSALQAKL